MNKLNLSNVSFGINLQLITFYYDEFYKIIDKNFYILFCHINFIYYIVLLMKFNINRYKITSNKT